MVLIIGSSSEVDRMNRSAYTSGTQAADWDYGDGSSCIRHPRQQVQVTFTAAPGELPLVAAARSVTRPSIQYALMTESLGITNPSVSHA